MQLIRCQLECDPVLSECKVPVAGTHGRHGQFVLYQMMPRTAFCQLASDEQSTSLIIHLLHFLWPQLFNHIEFWLLVPIFIIIVHSHGTLIPNLKFSSTLRPSAFGQDLSSLMPTFPSTFLPLITLIYASPGSDYSLVLIWQNHSQSILYLTAVLPNALLKCGNYWLSTTVGTLCVCEQASCMCLCPCLFTILTKI